MSNARDAATSFEDRIHSIERMRDSTRDNQRRWIEMDSTYVDAGAGDPGRVARLCKRAPAHRGTSALRTFAVIGCSARPKADDDPAPPSANPSAMRSCGRQYSLALLALVDALAAEPSGSPLATSASLDDVRATAFLVAGETVSRRPDASVIDQAVRRADRRLADLRVPLRATGYLAARDALGQMVAALLAVRLTGGP